MKSEIDNQRATNGTYNITLIIHKPTRRNIKPADDWYKWKQAEYIQLGNYEKQEIFDPSCKLPNNNNVLKLLWTYIY